MKFQSLEKLEFSQLKAYLLQEARTEPGRALLGDLHPYSSYEELREELAKVEEMSRLLAEEGRPPLPELRALRPVLEGVLKGRVLILEEVSLLRSYLLAAEGLRSFFREKIGPHLKGLVSSLPRLSSLKREISRLLSEDGTEIRTEASAKLAEIRSLLKAQEERLRRRLEALLRHYARQGWLQEELITKRRGRFVFPFRAEAKNRIPALLHDTSASGATVYLEPLEIVSLTNELEDLRLAEEREIWRLLEALSQRVAQEGDSLLLLEEIIAEIDALQAKAVFGERLGGALPKVKPEGEVKLFKAAHPLLLLSGREVVRNDFLFPEGKPVTIISGPNLGGKTVALKTVGLLVLMVQAAIPIPAAPDSELPFFEKVLVDIGDEQDLSQEESTFSAHVKNLRLILQEAAPRALILLDEIGRGTDPAEGAALAMAVLEALAESGARILATTHYEALKAFSLTRPDFLSLSVTFDEETGEPTYRLAYGVAGLSRGLLLAARLGLPKEIISRAREHLGREEERFEELLLALQRLEGELRLEKETLRRERETLLREKEALSREREALKAEFVRRQEAQEKALAQKIRELDEAFKAFVKELATKQIGPKKAAQKFEKFLKERIPSQEETSGELFPGARVRLKGLGQEGRVLRLKGGVAEVQIGPFRVEVGVQDLVVLPEEGRPKEGVSFTVSAEKEVPSSINLIGLTVEEALSELEKVLDRAFLAGKTRLTVIHGLGTGRLMRAIRQYLATHQQVASVRRGKDFEGGEAVTIVELATQEGAGGP